MYWPKSASWKVDMENTNREPAHQWVRRWRVWFFFLDFSISNETTPCQRKQLPALGLVVLVVVGEPFTTTKKTLASSVPAGKRGRRTRTVGRLLYWGSIRHKSGQISRRRSRQKAWICFFLHNRIRDNSTSKGGKGTARIHTCRNGAEETMIQGRSQHGKRGLIYIM